MAYNVPVGFGAGYLFMTPQVAAGVATPVRVGILQNVSLDFSFDEKPLYGQNQFPAAVARGKAKITCKAAFAQIDSRAISSLFFGGTPVAGQDVIIDLEPHTLSSTTLQAIANSGTFFQNDLGVFYATTGQPLSATSSGSEAVGWYSYSTTGTYKFSTADSTAALLFSYKYNATAAGGTKTTITNQPMGSFTPFQVDLFQFNPETVPQTQWGARLYKCMSSKLTLATKQDDWTIPDFDWSVYANPAGNVIDFNTAV